MRKNSVLPATILSIFLLAGPATAGNPSVEHGKKVFNDPTLGGSTNAKSCNSCHPGGRGLEKAGSNPKLAKVNNMCIKGPLKGKKIDVNSVEMQSLVMYIKSLGK